MGLTVEGWARLLEALAEQMIADGMEDEAADLLRAAGSIRERTECP